MNDPAIPHRSATPARLALLSLLLLLPAAPDALAQRRPRPGSLTRGTPAPKKPGPEPPRPDGVAAPNTVAPKPVEPVRLETLNVEELVKEVVDHGASMHRHLIDYTYTLRTVRRELGDKGDVKQQEERTFEAYPVRGEHLLVRRTKDGSPLPGWMTDSDRKEVVRGLERAQAEADGVGEVKPQPAATPAPPRWIQAGVSGRARGKIVYVSIDAAELLRSSEFHSPRLERFAGRQAVALQFRPRAGAAEALPPKKAYIASLVGTVWIDPVEKAVMRVEGWPATPPATPTGQDAPADRPADRPAFVYQQSRVEEGVWVPSLMRIDAGGDRALFNGLNWDVLFEFTDYKRFGSTIEKVEVGTDAPQP